MPDRATVISPSRSYSAGLFSSWPWLVMFVVMSAASGQLHFQGRRWWCNCGQPDLWSSDVNGPHNSQHLFDPYSFTHVLHGVVLCGLVAWAFPRMPTAWRLCLVVAAEAMWEVFENSSFVIERYRATTMAVGYQGDSIANSLGDIMSGAVGYLIARRLGLWRSVVFFFLMEMVLLMWIRDSLLLNILMLIYPLAGVKAWQTGS
jgi:hypothetical protein